MAKLDLAGFRHHRERLKNSLVSTHSLKDIPTFVAEKTYIKGKPYSFKDHEFQLQIISDESTEVNTQKCSQIGLTEVMARWTLGVCYNFPEFSAIITFPYAGDASNFARTRVDPIIEGSKELKEALDNNLNNSEIKRIKQSLLYFRGTHGVTAAISIPGDLIVSDEIDKSDPDTLTQYTSRLTHSSYKLRRNFSTPTVRGYGIDKLMMGSRRFKNMARCNHCGHWFYPDFFDHVRIPGYDNELQLLNKNTLGRTRFREATLHCPRCDDEPDLSPRYREYVLENDSAHFSSAGYYVSPFDAPRIITPVSLLEAMVQYNTLTEFKNQNLGQTSEEANDTLTAADIQKAFRPGMDLNSDTTHAMGCDMGLECHIMVGRLQIDGTLVVVHREKVLLGEFENRRRALAIKYSVVITVCDSQPYVDLILRLQRTNKNLFGGVFVETKSMAVYQIKMVDKDNEDGKLPIHQALINRNKALDEILGLYKHQEIVLQSQAEEEDKEYENHLLDMKRIPERNKEGDMSFRWVKSATGTDHWHFTTLYLYTACRLRGTVNREGMEITMPLAMTMKAATQRPLQNDFKKPSIFQRT